MQHSILIIDDDEYLTATMAEALIEPSSAFARRLLRKFRGKARWPKCSDQMSSCATMLPDALGFDTVSKLKTHPSTSQVPVIHQYRR